MDLVQVVEPEPLRGESRRERLRTRISEQSLYLVFEHVGIGEPLGFSEVNQLLVRREAPQEERQPGREIDIADSVVLPDLDPPWSFLESEHEVGTGQ